MKRLVLILASFVLVACSSGGSQGIPEADVSQDLASDVPSADLSSPDIADASPDAAPGVCEGAPLQRMLSTTADETFDLGPYVMSVTRDSAVIMWRTLTDSGGKVVYRLGTDGEEIEVVQDGLRTIHEIALADLETDAAYSYRVESDGVSSQEHVFRTAPSLGAPVRFAGWGDNQSGWKVFTEQVPLILEDGPGFLIGVGDLVDNGKNDPDWKEQLFDPARALLHQVPLFACIGNHEGNSHNWYDLLSYPYPEGDPDHETYYSFSWGNVFVVVIDAYKLPCGFGGVDTPQSEWLKEVLESPEAQAATWRIAYAHEPAVSESWDDGHCNYGGNPCIRDGILPLLGANGFHVYLSGHTHMWERGVVNGVVHMIVGGGGGHLDAWCEDLSETSVVHAAHHHFRVDAGCETLRIEGVTRDGQVFDWVEIAPTSPVTILDQGPADWLPDPPVNIDTPLWPDCAPMAPKILRSLDEGVADGGLPLGEVFQADPAGTVTLPAAAASEAFLLILYDLGTEMATTHGYDVLGGRGAAPGGLPPHPQTSPTLLHPRIGDTETLQVAATYLENIEAEVVLVNDLLVVYRDTTTEHGLEEPDMDHIQALADFFEDLILPRERFFFGAESDVDNDGRFGMLISYQVNLTGAYAFVTHCDLVDSAVCGYGNHQEMIYVAIPDPDSMIKTPEAFAELIAHELNHSIYFHRKFMNHGTTDWIENVYLSEGMSALAQDLTGFNRGNLFVARSGMEEIDAVSLADIHRYDPGVHYFDTRDGPLRGASYLFNRYVIDRAGGDLLSVEGAAQPSCGVTTLRGWFDAYLTGADLIEPLTGLGYEALAADFFTTLGISNRPGLEGLVDPAFSYLPVTTDPVTGNQRGFDPWGSIFGQIPLTGPLVRDLSDADGTLREGGVEYLRVEAAGPGEITLSFDTGDAPAPGLRVVRIQ